MIEWDGAELTAEELAPLVASSAGNYGTYTAFGVSAEGTVRGLSLHLERLLRDCATLSGHPLDQESVLGSLRRVAEAGPLPVMLRATVFGHHVLVTTRPPSPLPSGGLRVRTVPWTRDLPAVKHTGLFAATWQRNQAQAAGFDDALFVTAEGLAGEGLVAEGPTWNVAVSFGEELVWPDDACLPGTTRALLQRAWPAWVSRPVTHQQWRTATAAFATSAGIGVRPVTEINGQALPGDEKLLRTLQEAYASVPGEQLV